MIISTKGRYALRVITDLAEHMSNNYIPLKEIAARQGISQKYLESIMSTLSKGGFVEGAHGKGGGYRLTKPPKDYILWDILKCTEGTICTAPCLDEGAKDCERADDCKTLPIWKELNDMIEKFFRGITIEDLLNKTCK